MRPQVAVHAGSQSMQAHCGRGACREHSVTAAAPASEVEAIIRSLTMAAADVAAVEGRGHLALC